MTLHARGRAFAGLNLFSPRELPEARLMDMDGEVVHSWSAPAGSEAWQHVELARGGDLLVIVKESALGRLALDSAPRWVTAGRFHHDLAEAPNGEIYAFVSRDRMVSMYGTEVPILDEVIVRLSPQGEILGEISFYDQWPRRFSRKHAAQIRGWASENTIYEALETRTDGHVIPDDTFSDLFHLNSVEVLTGPLDGCGRRGDLLISARNVNTVLILDPETREIVWMWGKGVLEWQHHATPLADGRVLIFDNGVKRESSRVVEVAPATGAIVWEWRAARPEVFYSRSRGGSQRLPNGNTLITESDAGRVFEVDAAGEVVWDYYSDVLRTDADGTRERSTLFRMERIFDLERYALSEIAAAAAVDLDGYGVRRESPTDPVAALR